MFKRFTDVLKTCWKESKNSNNQEKTQVTWNNIAGLLTSIIGLMGYIYISPGSAESQGNSAILIIAKIVFWILILNIIRELLHFPFLQPFLHFLKAMGLQTFKTSSLRLRTFYHKSRTGFFLSTGIFLILIFLLITAFCRFYHKTE